MTRVCFTLTLLLALAGSVCGRGGAAPSPGEAPLPPGLLEDERNTITLFRRISPSVVFITNLQFQREWFSMNVHEIPAGTGSGFVWDRRGHVVTNFHVVQGGNAFAVKLADGTSYDAELVGLDPNKDLAVLHIEAPPETLDPLDLGNSEALVVGQKVLAVGNPFGLDQTLTTGVISALGREILSVEGTRIEDVIQTDASINPGNSGGPLVDSQGRLIGINTAIVSPSGSSAGVGFAVPVNTIKEVVPQLIEFGRVKRAELGVSVLRDDVARRWGVRGVIVREVVAGGPAARAGLRGIDMDRRGTVRSFDVIMAIEGRRITSYGDLYAALDDKHPGDVVRVTYRRGIHDREVKIRLEESD